MLTDEQEQLILTFWNESEVPPGLTDIVKVAFPTQELDGRSKEGREVKSFLAERNLRARPAQEYPAKPKVELTEDQKSYIDNHAVLMSALEIAKSLFDDNKLTNLHQETICVKEYVTETLPPVSSPGGVAAIGDYRAPKTMPAAISQINKYVTPGYDKERMNASQKKCVSMLIAYMNTFRFIHQVGTYTSQEEISLFESSFVRYTYDKDDLTEEEVDQYIVLCTELVISANIQWNIGHLNGLLRDAAEESEGKKISMGLMESLGDARREYNQCVTRQTKLLEALKGKRSERLKEQRGSGASVLNLFQLLKEENSRKKLVKIANMRKLIVKDTIDELSDMDEIKFRIFGLSKEEALNG